jgi:hypothetical protein
MMKPLTDTEAAEMIALNRAVHDGDPVSFLRRIRRARLLRRFNATRRSGLSPAGPNGWGR